VNVDSDHARKALVAFVIERALLKIGKTALDQVSNRLYEEHVTIWEIVMNIQNT
jgi:hypothetical protein